MLLCFCYETIVSRHVAHGDMESATKHHSLKLNQSVGQDTRMGLGCPSKLFVLDQNLCCGYLNELCLQVMLH